MKESSNEHGEKIKDHILDYNWEQRVRAASVVCVDRNADGLRWRFEAPDHAPLEWRYEDKADCLTYANVYVAVGGFQELGTGELGVPPRVCAAGRTAAIAYLSALPRITHQRVRNMFGISETELEACRNKIREAAAAADVGQARQL